MGAARLLCILTFLIGGLASAANDPRVQRGVEHFDQGEFALARDVLVTVVDSPVLTTPERARARSYLAAAYHALADVASAKAHLLILAREHPDAQLDPGLFLPELVALADEARAEVAQEPRPPEPVRPRSVPADDVPQKIVTPAPALEVAPPVAAGPKQPSLALAFVPFGVGQFSVDQHMKGTLFLTGEVLALGTSVVALAMFESNKISGPFYGGGVFRDPERAQTLQAIHLVAGYTGLALMVGGVIDALVSRSEWDEASAGGVSPSVHSTGQGLLIRF